MSDWPSGYRIRIKKRAKKALQPGGMSPRRQAIATRFISEHLILDPLKHVPGRTKQLHGRHAGLFQYDIDESYRLHYRVDTSERIVYVEYIGPHPKW